MNHHVIPAMALTLVLCARASAGHSPATERAADGTFVSRGEIVYPLGHAEAVLFSSLYGYFAVTAGAKPEG